LLFSYFSPERHHPILVDSIIFIHLSSTDLLGPQTKKNDNLFWFKTKTLILISSIQ
jgi:hypothetical protein